MIQEAIKPNRLTISNDSLELLKWIALVLMTGDHVNKFLLSSSNVVLFSLGRTVLPIFIFVLAYNMARDGTMTKGCYIRSIKRMLLFGILASPAFILLGGHVALVSEEKEIWWILNILFSMALLTWCLYSLEKGDNDIKWLWIGWLSFWVGGLFIEFWWSGLGLGVAIWWYFKNKSYSRIILALFFSLLFLLAVNQGNSSFLIAFILILLASKLPINFPRMKWFFYFYYPFHLTVILFIKELGGQIYII